MASSYESNMNVARTTDGRTMYSSAAFLAKILDRALPMLITERFGQIFTMPVNNGASMQFRRYDSLSWEPVELIEGVTPLGQELTWNNFVVDLHQYGGYVELTDVALATNELDIQEQATRVISEQATYVVEKIRLAVLLSGSNVEFANGAARSAVNTPLTLSLQRRIVRSLKRQLAQTITEVIASNARFYTENVLPCYVGVCHSDLEADIRGMEGFKDAVDYGTQLPWENEIGSVEGVRYVYSTIMPIYTDEGGAATNAAGATMVSTSGTDADVYPVIFIAKDAFGIVPLKGMDSLTPSVVMPSYTISDPLAQRMTIGWKTMQAAVILNQDWIIRAEVAVTSY